MWQQLLVSRVFEMARKSILKLTMMKQVNYKRLSCCIFYYDLQHINRHWQEIGIIPLFSKSVHLAVNADVINGQHPYH